jgi:hypothetical protein
VYQNILFKVKGRAGGMSVVECAVRMCQALGSISSPKRKRKRKGDGEGEREGE